MGLDNMQDTLLTNTEGELTCNEPLVYIVLSPQTEDKKPTKTTTLLTSYL